MGEAVKSEGRSPIAAAMSSDQVFSASIVGVVVILAAWAAGWQRSDKAGDDISVAAACLLNRVVALCLGDGEYSYNTEDDEFTMHIVGSKLDYKTCQKQWPSVARLLGVADDLLVSEILVAIGQKLRMKSRLAESTVSAAKHLFNGLVGLCATRFELLVAREAVVDNLLSLPTLRLNVGGRPRGISTARKRALSCAVHSASGMKKIGDYAAAEAISAKARGDEPPVKPASARLFPQAILFQYFICSRRHWHGLRHVHIACDAGRVSNDDLLMSAMWSPETQIAVWSPPQATELSPKFGSVAPSRPP